MALEAGQAFVDLVPRLDPSFASDAARQVESATTPLIQRIGDRFDAIGERLRATGAKLTTFVTLPLVGAGVAAFKFASDLGESTSKAQVVFGDMFGVIDKFAAGAAKNLGISRQEALESAGTFGNLFRAMGIGLPVAADMSTHILTLASDLASFNNADPKEVLESLRAGLVGETEPLRKFGVNINQARIEAKALELGLWDGEGALTASAKAQASYALILEDTTLAQGDFARTAGGAANKQRILVAQAKDLAANLGTKLLPIGQKILGWVTKLFEGFDRLSPKMQDIILIVGLVAAAAGPLIYVIGAIATVIGFILSPIGAVVIALVAIAAAAFFVYKNWDTIWPEVQRIADKVWAWLKEHAAFLVDAITGIIAGVEWIVENWDRIWAEVKRIAAEVWAWLEDNIGPVFEVAARAVEVAMDRISDVVDVAVAVVLFIWEHFGDTILSVLETAWNTVVGIVEGALDIIRGVLDIFIAIFSGDWDAAWAGVQAIVSGAWGIITSVISGALDTALAIISGALSFIGFLFGLAWEGIKSVVSGAWNAIIGIVSGGINAVVNFIAGLPGKIMDLGYSMLLAGISLGSAVINGIKGAIEGAVGIGADIANGILGAFKAAWNAIARTINDIIPNDIDIPLAPDIDLPDNPLPTFHRGGRVPGPPGSEMLAILQAGEEVISAADVRNGSGAAGAVDARQYVFNGYDERDILEELAWSDITAGVG